MFVVLVRLFIVTRRHGGGWIRLGSVTGPGFICVCALSTYDVCGIESTDMESIRLWPRVDAWVVVCSRMAQYTRLNVVGYSDKMVVRPDVVSTSRLMTENLVRLEKSELSGEK